MSKSYRPADLTPHPILTRIVPAQSPDETKTLRESLDEHGQLSPVVASRRDGKLYVLDGLNRREWAMESPDPRTGGPRLLVCTVLEALSEEQEVEIGLELNGPRRNMSMEQRREMVQATLKEYPAWSDRRIAKACGVSDKTVGAIRRDLIATAEIPQLEKRTGADGKERPAHKPPTPTSLKEPSNAEKLRRLREAQASGSAAFEEPAEPAEPEPHDDTPEPEPAAPTQPAAPDRSKLVPPRRPYTARMKALIAAAQDAADATEEELAAVPTNDLMIAGLKRARDLLDRIIAHHTSKGRNHVSA